MIVYLRNPAFGLPYNNISILISIWMSSVINMQ